jgi:hypothetical protein
MGPSEIAQFVGHWHEAVARSLDDSDQESFLDLASVLRQLFTRQAPLRRLASNPLMCAVLCALHADKKAALPSDRIGLYRTALHTLAFRRDAERGVRDSSGLSDDQMLIVLSDLAWWMVRQGYTEAPQETAADRIALTLERMPGAPSARVLLKFLLRRTGLLAEPAVGRLEFVHKTFLEYLAADHAGRAFEVASLIGRADDDNWTEIIELAAGLAPPREREELITGLLDRPVKPAQRAPVLLLAARCAEIAPELRTGIREKVSTAFSGLVPPSTIAQGVALSYAGDAAISLLEWRSTLTTDETRASIRALSRIATDEALEQLVPYAQDDRKRVIQELLRAADAFDAETFGTRVLAESPLQAGKLEIVGATSLSYLAHLKHLRKLSFDAGGDFVDVERLASVSQLEELKVANASEITSVGDLGVHGALVSLTLIDLPNLQSLSGVERMSLRSLHVGGAPRLENIHEILNCESLTRLTLDETAVTDLALLDGHATLTYLRVANQGLVQLSTLADLPYLKSDRAGWGLGRARPIVASSRRAD